MNVCKLLVGAVQNDLGVTLEGAHDFFAGAIHVGDDELAPHFLRVSDQSQHDTAE